MEQMLLKGLVETSELRSMLGLSDKRSIMAWLRKHNAPIVVLGRKTYTRQQFIEDLIAAALGSNYTSQNSSDAIRATKKGVQVNAPKKAAIAPKHTESKRLKNQHSKAATDLINTLHSAE